ncbi:hypothetical protein [Streptomyces sp. NPDC088775]|uniref:hypothetical protein n=1 Tax=Streptomyces sp. NPDC088775 TaxID=3365896 RepID=UPI0037F79512
MGSVVIGRTVRSGDVWAAVWPEWALEPFAGGAPLHWPKEAHYLGTQAPAHHHLRILEAEGGDVLGRLYYGDYIDNPHLGGTPFHGRVVGSSIEMLRINWERRLSPPITSVTLLGDKPLKRGAVPTAGSLDDFKLRLTGRLGLAEGQWRRGVDTWLEINHGLPDSFSYNWPGSGVTRLLNPTRLRVAYHREGTLSALAFVDGTCRGAGQNMRQSTVEAVWASVTEPGKLGPKGWTGYDTPESLDELVRTHAPVGEGGVGRG